MKYCANLIRIIAIAVPDLNSFPILNIISTPNNGFQCRRYYLERARSDAAFWCPSATIGANNCGTRCEAYCGQLMRECAGPELQFVDFPDCLSKCAGFPVLSSDVQVASGDSVQCRFYYSVLAGQTGNATTNCPKAGPNSTICADPVSPSASASASSSLSATGSCCSCMLPPTISVSSSISSSGISSISSTGTGGACPPCPAKQQSDGSVSFASAETGAAGGGGFVIGVLVTLAVTCCRNRRRKEQQFDIPL